MGTTSTQTPTDVESPDAPRESEARLLSLSSRLSGLTPEKIAHHQREIAQLLRSNGLAYGSIGQRRLEERPWQLDVSPNLIAEAEWQALSTGLIQRARVKQALLADVYGEQRLFSQQILPPQAVFAHRGYMRAVRQVPSSWHLPLCNIDVTRTKEGKWLATGANCQAPRNVGYALENRLVMSQVLNDQFRFGQVKRQSPYFRALLSTLSSSMDIDERCVLLGYGAKHRNHFEHAYLAKYLGYTLVESKDLTVRDQRVWMKTVAGLQRVDVILRFIDDQDADQLAYSGNSTGTGVPGLLHAAIANNVQIINPLGVGVLDNPALYAYMPDLCQFYLGETLLLPNAKTYWLGDPASLSLVLENLDSLTIRDINSSAALKPFAQLDEVERQGLLAKLHRTPHQFVATEQIDREFVSSSVNQLPSQLPMTLRTYLANSGEQFEAMPGGLCLLDNQTAFNGKVEVDASKDVWILSETPVSHDTLLTNEKSTSIDYAILDGELPSRVAENLFWFGRYAERLESSLRNLRSALQIIRRDDSDNRNEQNISEVLAAQLRATTIATGALPGFVGAGASRRLQRPEIELHALLFDEAKVGSLASTLRSLRFTAESVRDRISYDLLRVLNQVDDCAQVLQQEKEQKPLFDKPPKLNGLIDHLNNLIDSCAAISGMTHESFTHGDGWQFMMLGRRIERARQSNAVLGSVLLNNQNDPAALENLLRVFDSVMTYRSRYRSQLDARLVLNLLLLDERNPRSVAYQLVHIDRSIRSLPGMRRADHSNPLLKLVTAGLSRVRLAEPHELLQNHSQQRQSLKKFIMIIEEITAKISTSLSATYLTHTEAPTSLNEATLLTANLNNNSSDSTEERL